LRDPNGNTCRCNTLINALDDDDRNFNPLGARGIGEIGITGVPAAIANAIYHATGKRIRNLPITGGGTVA